MTIDNPTCSFEGFHVDQAQDTAGVVHGFSGLWGSDCNTGLVIRYFEGSGAGWTVEDTPFRGFVVAAAWDTTGTYLLYVDRSLNLRISKRQADGTYLQGRLLSGQANIGPDGSSAQGDVVASGGRWWAVWRDVPQPHLRHAGRAAPGTADRGRARSRGRRLDHAGVAQRSATAVPDRGRRHWRDGHRHHRQPDLPALLGHRDLTPAPTAS